MLRHYIVSGILGMCDLIFIAFYNILIFGFIFNKFILYYVVIIDKFTVCELNIINMEQYSNASDVI